MVKEQFRLFIHYIRFDKLYSLGKERNALYTLKKRRKIATVLVHSPEKKGKKERKIPLKYQKKNK